MLDPVDVMITCTPDDDQEFLGISFRVLKSSVALYRPSEIYVVHIDNWFDVKWHAFSGKVSGALGVWNEELTVPPFRPSRVLSQSHFSLDTPLATYVASGAAPLHRVQSSSANSTRSIRRLSDSAIFFWYSGASAETHRGSLMLYRIADTEVFSWYASYYCAPEWNLLHTREISRTELLHLGKGHAMPMSHFAPLQ
jgi:hypothetical protein